jgi:hypothetical protein
MDFLLAALAADSFSAVAHLLDLDLIARSRGHRASEDRQREADWALVNSGEHARPTTSEARARRAACPTTPDRSIRLATRRRRPVLTRASNGHLTAAVACPCAAGEPSIISSAVT